MFNEPEKYILSLLLLLFLAFPGYTKNAPFLKYQEDAWVDSTLKRMTLQEKIGQVVMITVYPDQGAAQKEQLIRLIKKYQPGGILVMKGSPTETAKLINELQAVSATPLLVATDGETGLGFRLDSTLAYPRAQALGAVRDTLLIRKMGYDIGKQFRLMGIQVNFAPVADINTNPDNPVINIRSFGENKFNVSAKTVSFAGGLQEAGVLAVAKHFPGHGDTSADSHKTLPELNKNKETIDSLEAYPFKESIINGIGGIMTAHIHVTSFDKNDIPASLSRNIVQNYLRRILRFEGLVITDAMNMKGVGQPSGKAEVEALKAGNDMVEFVPDIAETIKAIQSAVRKGKIDEKDLDSKCRKILAIKRWSGLNKYKPVNTENITQKLNNPLYVVRLRKLVENSLTVLRNRQVLPVNGLDTLKIASVNIGGDSVSAFQKMLGNYTEVENFVIPKNASTEALDQLQNDLKPYNLVIAGIQNINLYPSDRFGISDIQTQAVDRIASTKKSIFVFFGNAYALKYFDGIKKAAGVVMAYENSKFTGDLAAQLLFGAFDASGRLPVTINNEFKEGDGLPLKNIGRFTYTIPEEAGISSVKLSHRIDSIAYLGIDSMAYPGCQVLIALNGKLIFHKCYGYLTYKKEVPVTCDDLYDWASLTKITGPLPALMKLNSEGKFDLDVPFSRYWPDFIGSNKENIRVRDVLAHQARLQPWILFWQSATKSNGKLRTRVFSTRPGGNFTVRVSSNLYMNRNYQKDMFDQIRDSPLLKSAKYVYSGLCFYLFPKIIENLTGMDYETYLKENFYHPLGAYTITYNPYKYYPLSEIVPTEYDDIFRKELIRGFVHDEGAAMMGGVSGNAGLFGTANDLAKLMQMYMQKGQYGGVRYIPEKTINEFTRRQFPENDNRRGLGFDKPFIDNNRKKLSEAYPAVDASEDSFGHSGYTGTFAWADPDNNLLFIFFSNRVHPTRENSKIYDLNIRPAMHQAIYDCIKEGL